MTPSLFITGCDSGLGNALARVFHDNGWHVFAGHLHAAPPYEDLAGDRFIPVQVDVGSDDSVAQAATIVRKNTGSLDMVINNAGINPAYETLLEDLDFQVVQQVLNVNALGALRVTKEMVDLLRAGSLKRIVNVSSEAGSLISCTRTSWYGYCMSKAALNMQSRILQNYLRDQGFLVLIVHPGWMRSGMGSPDATFDPIEPARMLFPLVTAPRTEKDPMYFQFDGTPLDW